MGDRVRRAAVGGVCVAVAACASVAAGPPRPDPIPGVVQRPAPQRDLGPVVPDTTHGARTRTGLHRKRVVDKEAPNTLVAGDRSRCVVDPGRFEKREVGDRVWCVWRAPESRS
jgi:hypothetical protein